MEVVFFSPQDLALSACLSWDQEWKKQVLSTPPGVVYDRFLPRNPDEWTLLQQTNTLLVKSGCLITNPLGLTELLRDKLVFHQFLLRHNIPTILPIRLEEASEVDLDRLLAESEVVYVKPIAGAKGTSIGVIATEEKGFAFYDGTGLLRGRFPNTKSSLSWLKSHFDSLRTVIMRSAHCSRLLGGSFDIRVLVQNAALEQYVVTGMAARLGREGAWVSNLAKGGRALTITELMEQLQPNFVERTSQLAERLTSLSLECAHLLHNRCGSFAEVGIDFVLDAQTVPLILEANSKPARWIFVQLADSHSPSSIFASEFRELRKLSVQTPLKHVLARLQYRSRPKERHALTRSRLRRRKLRQR